MEMKGQKERRFTVRLQHLDKYRFQSQAGEDGNDHGVPFVSDEPDPVGDASGPATPSMLGAAIGHCLSASLLECLRRARIPVSKFEADVESVVQPNEDGLPRITEVLVHLQPTISPDGNRHGRCADIFENYCTVSSSIKRGIAVNVDVDWQLD
ncbi:MAG TPA: OsmC family protein [Gammaproteobacteria bacterium]|nr:OsmC family protein [Gammaproteobacteria bacterium]